VCAICVKTTDGPLFCGWCGARLPQRRYPTAIGKRHLAYYQERWTALQQEQPMTHGRHEKLMQELARFQLNIGANPSPFAVTPIDIVQFLMSKDGRGTTVVHAASCPQWHCAAGQQTCQCPVRAAALGLKATRGALQGAFRDLGLTQEWNAATGTGNPVNSAEVRRFERLNLRHQALRGVRPRQAPLFGADVWRHLLRLVLHQWRMAMRAHAWKKGVLYIRDALFYALMWYTGLRGRDVLRLLWQQLTPHALCKDVDPALLAARLNVVVTKTRFSPSTTRVLWIPHGNQFSHINNIVTLHQRTMVRVGLQQAVKSGRMFRNVSPARGGTITLTTPLTWVNASLRFKMLLRAARIVVPLSLQSFHGSCARYDRDAGASREHTCALIDWTPAMYHHYTDGREAMTLGQAMGVGVVGEVAPPPPEEISDGEE
jgi:integrase